MKLISLNTWGGKFFEPLIEFIKNHSKNTDIFCFQEIYDTKSDVKTHRGIRANLLSEVKDTLPYFQVFYFPTISEFNDEAKHVDFNLTHGTVIFVKKNIVVNSHADYFIYKDESSQSLKKDFSNLAIPLQFIKINLNGKMFAIFNFHGTPFPGDKLDTENRLNQSEKVKKIIDAKLGAKILVGDFNLLPQTKCIKIFENGLRNLIKEFNIERTRSNLSPYFGEPDFQKYADYTFVSSDVNVIDFKIPTVNVSDHLPMILEFS